MTCLRFTKKLKLKWNLTNWFFMVVQNISPHLVASQRRPPLVFVRICSNIVAAVPTSLVLLLMLKLHVLLHSPQMVKPSIQFDLTWCTTAIFCIIALYETIINNNWNHVWKSSSPFPTHQVQTVSSTLKHPTCTTHSFICTERRETIRREYYHSIKHIISHSNFLLHSSISGNGYIAYNLTNLSRNIHGQASSNWP